jgi:hypothetical protein
MGIEFCYPNSEKYSAILGIVSYVKSEHCEKVGLVKGRA